VSLSPFPIPLAEPMRNESAVDEHRNLNCRHYDECLNHSIREKWESFSCTRCPLRGIADVAPNTQDFARQRRNDNA